ncbi:MAG: sugar transferase [Angelakisella sp.]
MKKKRQWKRITTLALAAVLWAAMVIIWAYVWRNFYGDTIIRPFGYKGNWLVYMLYGGILLCFTVIYGGYRVGYYKRNDVMFSNILSMLFTNGITYVQTCLVGRAIMPPTPMIAMSVADIILIAIWSSAAFRLYAKVNPPHDMLVIYGKSESAESLIGKMTGRSEKYNICRTISIDEGIDKVCEVILQYESVIICDVQSEYRNKLLKFCFSHSIRTYLTPKISDIIIRGAENISLFDTPLLLCRNRGLTVGQRFVKRAMDIVIATVGIVLSSPFMLAAAAAIKLQDGGAILFKQKRCTINNKVFEVYKFRSMIEDAESDGKPHPAVDNDPRITPVGRFIRKTRLDELPQFFNIFMGDMSLVGPRPERIEHVEKYTAEMPEFAFRSKVKGGLTGYAQIVGKYNTTPYDKLKLDLMYIENYSIFEDIKLILMTIKIIFVKESTDGFDVKVSEKISNTAMLREDESDNLR